MSDGEKYPLRETRVRRSFYLLLSSTGVEFRSSLTQEVRMPARLVFLLLVLLVLPAFSQQPNLARQINQRIDAHEQRISRIATDPTPAKQIQAAARLQSIHHDAEELATVSASVQSGLQQLAKGLLVMDLDANLKKMEKLSKKLRREMYQ